MRNIFRLRQIFNLLGLKQPCCAIRIVGTNGKGSTGRYLALMSAMSNIKPEGHFDNAATNHLIGAKAASFKEEAKRYGWMDYRANNFKKLNQFNKNQALNQSLNGVNLKVVHFSSPHLLSVYERFWASYLSDEQIEHRVDLALGWLKERLAKLDKNLIGELNFFELTCLILPLAFYDANLWVVEAGLGAFYDSSANFSYLLHAITPISFDHPNFYKNTDEIIEDKFKVKGKIISACEYEHLAHLRLLQKQIVVLNEAKSQDFLDDNFALAKLAYLHLFKRPFSLERPKLDLLGRRHFYKGILIDVAHNEAGAKALANYIKTPAHIICAFKAGKDNAQIIKALKPVALKFSALNSCAYEALKQADIKIAFNQDELNALKNEIFSQQNDFVICGSFDAARWAYTEL